MQITSIMIIDDSESDQYLAESVIAEFDPSVEIFNAYDGQEALDKLDLMTEQPSLILLDINMPRMNGFEFLYEYSKKEKQGVVVAMLTSSDQEEDKNKAKKYPFVRTYFTKPIQVANLKEIELA